LMSRSALNHMDRLERLQGLLKDGDTVIAEELAAELGISMRTLRRDIAVLRERGVPLEADRGRGGGMRLAPRWSIGRLHLGDQEAIDLLLSMAIAEKMDSPILLGELGRVRQKLAAAFSDSQQSRIRSLRRRILIGSPASEVVLATYHKPDAAVIQAVKQAFFDMRVLRIEYRDQAERSTTREIEPQFLYLYPPVWYLHAWDRLRDGVRSFRIDRLRGATELDTTFRARDPAIFLVGTGHAPRGL
jgi:predicted DNA-binding transcriptional regulator YafY